MITNLEQVAAQLKGLASDTRDKLRDAVLGTPDSLACHVLSALEHDGSSAVRIDELRELVHAADASDLPSEQELAETAAILRDIVRYEDWLEPLAVVAGPSPVDLRAEIEASFERRVALGDAVVALSKRLEDAGVDSDLSMQVHEIATTTPYRSDLSADERADIAGFATAIQSMIELEANEAKGYREGFPRKACGPSHYPEERSALSLALRVLREPHQVQAQEVLWKYTTARAEGLRARAVREFVEIEGAEWSDRNWELLNEMEWSRQMFGALQTASANSPFYERYRAQNLVWHTRGWRELAQTLMEVDYHRAQLKEEPPPDVYRRGWPLWGAGLEDAIRSAANLEAQVLYAKHVDPETAALATHFAAFQAEIRKQIDLIDATYTTSEGKRPWRAVNLNLLWDYHETLSVARSPHLPEEARLAAMEKGIRAIEARYDEGTQLHPGHHKLSVESVRSEFDNALNDLMLAYGSDIEAHDRILEFKWRLNGATLRRRWTKVVQEAKAQSKLEQAQISVPTNTRPA